jgi:hypothetical protein
MSESRRGWKAGLDQLHQMRSIRLKEQGESGDSGTRSHRPSGSQAEPSAPSEPAGEAAHRTEAAAPEVAGCQGGNGEPGGDSFVDFAISRPDGGLDVQASVNQEPNRPGFGDFLPQRE